VKSWLGWLAAIVATLVTWGLVAADIADGGMRRWWAGHALTTDTVSGLLVLLITVLVVNQVVRRRQLRGRSQAIAAQAAIMVTQASRTVRAVTGALDGSGDRDAAADEVRTYLMMLLIGAPVLIDARTSRSFLEEAQHLGGEMARALVTMSKDQKDQADSSRRLDDAVKRLQTASAPLMQVLDPEARSAVTGVGAGDAGPAHIRSKPSR
jgi:4-amino-4-deoxy-L-arabinose transferase-like glycosyltransferase